jgi:membrane protease YdiL (CAAX protease family)
MGAVGVGGVARLSDDPAPEPGLSRGKLVGWVVFVSVLAGLSYYARYALPESDTDNRELLYSYGTAVAAIAQYALMLGITLLIARGTNLRSTLALRRPRSLRTVAWQTPLALVAIWLAGAALSPFLPAGEEQGFVPDRWEPDRAGALAANAAVVVLVGPTVEELVYRGLGYTAVRAHLGAAAAVLVTAVAFAGAHGLVIGFPILLAFGIAVALLRRSSESVYPGMVVHAIFNAAALALGIGFGDEI